MVPRARAPETTICDGARWGGQAECSRGAANRHALALARCRRSRPTSRRHASPSGWQPAGGGGILGRLRRRLMGLRQPHGAITQGLMMSKKHGQADKGPAIGNGGGNRNRPALTVKTNDKGQIWSHIRQKWLIETPEERVRASLRRHAPQRIRLRPGPDGRGVARCRPGIGPGAGRRGYLAARPKTRPTARPR